MMVFALRPLIWLFGQIKAFLNIPQPLHAQGLGSEGKHGIVKALEAMAGIEAWL